MSVQINDSELIINPDGSIYHLNLRPEDIAHDIITVGDPDRVDAVAKRLDNIKLVKQKREFKTITGTINNKFVTIVSTGIGTDNIDIVFTELDALVNIDFKSRMVKENHTSLNFYRIGTSGTIRKEIDIDTIIISKYAIGLDSLMHYYDWLSDNDSCDHIDLQANTILNKYLPSIKSYTTAASSALIEKYSEIGNYGITITATGFYGPQGRKLIGVPRNLTFIDQMSSIQHAGVKATNLEMETAGIYGMSSLLGHHAISFNAILANRVKNTFSKNPGKTIDELIDGFFEVFCD